jgi:hypothetical protein
MGGVIAIVLVLDLFWETEYPNAWWFSVTTIIAFLSSEGTNALFKRWARRISGELWIPVRFSIFVIIMLVLPLFGASVNGGIQQGLGISLAAGPIIYALNLFLPPLLYLDFLLSAGFRRVRRSRSILESDEETWNSSGE